MPDQEAAATTQLSEGVSDALVRSLHSELEDLRRDNRSLTASLLSLEADSDASATSIASLTEDHERALQAAHDRIAELEEELSMLRQSLEDAPPVSGNALLQEDHTAALERQQARAVAAEESQRIMIERERQQTRAVAAVLSPPIDSGPASPGKMTAGATQPTPGVNSEATDVIAVARHARAQWLARYAGDLISDSVPSHATPIRLYPTISSPPKPFPRPRTPLRPFPQSPWHAAAPPSPARPLAGPPSLSKAPWWVAHLTSQMNRCPSG